MDGDTETIGLATRGEPSPSSSLQSFSRKPLRFEFNFDHEGSPKKSHICSQWHGESLVKVKDDPAGNLSSMHLVVNFRQVAQADGLVDDLDLAAAGNVKTLDGVLAVAHIAADDVEGLEDGEEDVGLDVGVGRKSDGHEGAAGPEVVEGLLVGLSAASGDNGRRGTLLVGSRVLDGLDEVLLLCKVDEGLGAQRAGELLLLSARVDGNDTVASIDGVLDGQVTKTTTGTDDGDGLAGREAGLLDGTVDGDTWM